VGKWTFFDFQQAFFESNNSIQFGFGKLAGRGLVRSAPPAAQVDLSGGGCIPILNLTRGKG
jgi:hypothetical protein